MKTLILSLLLFISCIALAKETTAGKDDLNPISGDVQLLSHFIERGLSYSDQNPAMNASFLFNLSSEARIGFWGSNISNLSANDDNFWFKFLGVFEFDISTESHLAISVSDDHFYKSSIRNGQMVGFDFNYKEHLILLEWQNNLEGTKANAEYLRYGRLFDFKKIFKYGGYVGFTNSHSDVINSFFDARAVISYDINTTSIVEVGATYNSNKSQFGSHADPAYYLSLKMSY